MSQLIDTINKELSNLTVIQRNGNSVHFDASRISFAIMRAFLDEEGQTAAISERVHNLVEKITLEVCETLKRYLRTGGSVGIEDIQDHVERILLRHNYEVGRSYVLHREEHRKLRLAREAQKATEKNLHPVINVLTDDGKSEPLDIEKLSIVVKEACGDLENVFAEPIVSQTTKSVFDGVLLSDVHKALIMSARTKIEDEPNYSFVAARLLLNIIRREVTKGLSLPIPSTQSELSQYYGLVLVKAIKKGIEFGLLDAKLLEFDLDLLGSKIDPMRDFKFNYLGLQTLYDRYFLHENNIRFEMPQIFFMRVAMGLAINESDKNTRALEFYNVLSNFDFMSATPTLFNSGTVRSQLSSCFISTIPDDLRGIYGSIQDNALMQKFAGGIGNDWTYLRALDAHIKGTNGKSLGVIPFMKVANDTAIAVNQGGKRKGAVCGYLEVWHRDIEEFLELRKNTGDERRRTHDMNTANWIPDLFMQRVLEDKEWTLFSPDEVKDLHDLYGTAFKEAYENYELLAEQGKIKNFKKLRATNLWRKMLSMLFETGHPWLTFKDSCNIRSPQRHVGVIHSSNLCTEITLNTSFDEIAVCNLGSINLANHVSQSGLNLEKLKATIKTAIRMLDNVIDANYYPVVQTRRSNLRHRPIGLGIMGFQDALYIQNISYASDAAVTFADFSMEHISYYAIAASNALAKERGSYSTFEGSLWSKGILPIDSINLLKAERGEYLTQDTTKTLDWDNLRNAIKTYGMRNSNVLAIAPTATIANICGVSASIEPTYQNIYVKSNLSGEFTVVNQYLVEDLKNLHMWDNVMVADLKYFNGSVKDIERIPKHIRDKYLTAFEIDPIWLVQAASRRQKWIDQAQSLNLYIANPSGKKLSELYTTGWLLGLKTFYYLRSLSATDIEKSTINRSNLNAVNVNQCSLENKEDCEACQ